MEGGDGTAAALRGDSRPLETSESVADGEWGCVGRRMGRKPQQPFAAFHNMLSVSFGDIAELHIYVRKTPSGTKCITFDSMWG